MLNLCLAVIVSVLNMAYAAVIYLSLHGWIVPLETSGMQLLMHIFVTAPIVLVSTVWLFLVSKYGKLSASFWKVNLAGIIVPVVSIQTGVSYYYYDIVGLAVTVLVPVALVTLFFRQVGRNANN